MPVAELTMAFPWELCFLEDPQTTEEVPPIETRGQAVSVTRTALSIVVQHEVDGEATVRLHVGPFEPAGTLIFDGRIESVSGEMRLTDATATAQARAAVGAGWHTIRIFADQVSGPELVDIVLG